MYRCKLVISCFSSLDKHAESEQGQQEINNSVWKQTDFHHLTTWSFLKPEETQKTLSDGLYVFCHFCQYIRDQMAHSPQ